MKLITTSSGREIRIFDNVFDYNTRINFKSFCQNSSYQLNGSSLDSWEMNGRFHVCKLTDVDFVNFNFYNSKHENLKSVLELLGKRKPSRSWFLFSDLSTKIHLHHDGDIYGKNNLSVLYYVNIEWKDEWGGETIFASDEGEVEIALPYKPGRVVVFDSKIPHKAGYSSPDAPWRFTFNTVFE